MWIQDPLGDVSLSYLGTQIARKVVSIDRPYLLNAWKFLHAGYVPPNVDAGGRVVLVAVSSINIGSLEQDVIEELMLLGFRINTETDLKEAFQQPCCVRARFVTELLATLASSDYLGPPTGPATGQPTSYQTATKPTRPHQNQRSEPVNHRKDHQPPKMDRTAQAFTGHRPPNHDQ